jgi:hypothetical protein
MIVFQSMRARQYVFVAQQDNLWAHLLRGAYGQPSETNVRSADAIIGDIDLEDM